MNKSAVLLLNQVGIHDIDLVGEKSALLGELLQQVTKTGIKIPPGFVITVNAYNSFISYNALGSVISSILSEIDLANPGSFQRAAQKIRGLISNAKFPPELSQEIIETYFELSEAYGQDATDVAVRSSAVGGERTDASFARLHETYLNVLGPVALLDAIRNCFASLFTGRAMLYRHNAGIDHLKVGFSVCIQKMVRSDLGVSGVAFSSNTEAGCKEALVINGSYGLGELVVQGGVLPDAYIINRSAFKAGLPSIIEKRMGVKDKIMVYGENANERVKIIPVEKELQARFCLNDEAVLQLASQVIEIEEYYSSILEKYTPMDIEWAIDGLSKELFVVQASPGIIHSENSSNKILSTENMVVSTL